MSIQKLEIQILVENVADVGGILGEAGFSALARVESPDSELNVLFDTGPSPIAFLHNIKKLKVDFTALD
ncbi:MAG: hypothetical protein ACFFAE_10610, partial [Candidatus Hodarchaeota archaeon]